MKENMKVLVKNTEGKVLAPVALWMIGVPGFLCFLLWLFYFKNQ